MCRSQLCVVTTLNHLLALIEQDIDEHCLHIIKVLKEAALVHHNEVQFNGFSASNLGLNKL